MSDEIKKIFYLASKEGIPPPEVRPSCPVPNTYWIQDENNNKIYISEDDPNFQQGNNDKKKKSSNHVQKEHITNSEYQFRPIKKEPLTENKLRVIVNPSPIRPRMKPHQL